MRGSLGHDEELGAGGIGDGRARHGQHAAGVRQVILEPIRSKFAADLIARAAHAGAFRVAALDHEARDNAVEGQAVIKALFCEGNKVIYRVRRNLGVQLGLDDVAVFHFDGNNRICHVSHTPNHKIIFRTAADSESIYILTKDGD